MTALLAEATQLVGNGGSNVIPAAKTASAAANAAANTVLSIKDAWSSPSNCIHSNYCRIPAAIIIVIGLLIIIGCCCCIKGCVDCISCCCCRSSARSRERLRPPDAQVYAAQNYGYGQQPPPYQSAFQPRTAAGSGSLFPMPERPKPDEEQGLIKMDELRPQHAYVDGDSIVSELPVKPKETLPATTLPAATMPRAPTAPYPLHDDDDYHPPPPALLPGGYSSGRSSPVRRDYAPSPHRQSYGDEYAYRGGGYSSDDRGYYGYNAGGGYR